MERRISVTSSCYVGRVGKPAADWQIGLLCGVRSSREMDARKTTVQNQRLTQSLQGSAARPFSPGERIALNWFSKRFDATMRAARCLRENRSAFT
jgi:hypothetical protein